MICHDLAWVTVRLDAGFLRKHRLIPNLPLGLQTIERLGLSDFKETNGPSHMKVAQKPRGRSAASGGRRSHEDAAGRVYLANVAAFLASSGVAYGQAPTAPATSPPACPVTTQVESTAIARAWHDDVINRRNPTKLSDILGPEVVHHAAGGYPKILNAEGVAAMMDDFLAASNATELYLRQLMFKQSSHWVVAAKLHKARMQHRSSTPTQARCHVVQTAAKIVLEPIFEADFEDSAYGYRPRRSAIDAVKETHRLMCRVCVPRTPSVLIT